MKYMGGKSRHAKHILPIILANRTPSQFYIEPFVGGFNIIDKVTGPRIASDTHRYLIELFRAIQDGWIPPSTITEPQYNDIRTNPHHFPVHLVGFVGFGCSYSGKWFGGYARSLASDGTPRNHTAESQRNLLRQAPFLTGIQIHNLSYDQLTIPPSSLIYCDPPYANTTSYKDTFDTASFWQWVRDMHSIGHTVFVSEYMAPSDFICVWQKTVNSYVSKNSNGHDTRTEKLFTLTTGPAYYCASSQLVLSYN